MVLPAVLCDPARNSRQAHGCDRAGRLDSDSRILAVAGHLSCALGALPTAIQAVLLALCDRVRRTWLARLQAAGRHLRYPRAYLHHLLLRVFPRRPAAARNLRKDQTVAEFNFGIGTWREGEHGDSVEAQIVFSLASVGDRHV